MFSVVDPDYTAFVRYVIVVSVVAVFTVVCLLIRHELRKMGWRGKLDDLFGDGLGHLLGMILFFSVMLTGLFGAFVYSDAEKEAYYSNVVSVQDALNDKYSGDFVVYAKYLAFLPGVDFSHLDSVERENVKVERKIDGAVYVYRLVFDSEGQPDVIRVVSSDSVEYPSLAK